MKLVFFSLVYGVRNVLWLVGVTVLLCTIGPFYALYDGVKEAKAEPGRYKPEGLAE